MSVGEGDQPAGQPQPTEIVAARIVQRYANPARKAFLYLFRLKPGAPLDVLPPDAESVLAAWVDEGRGLLPTPIPDAIARCAAAMRLRADPSASAGPPPLALRKRMMARAALFSLTCATSLMQPDSADAPNPSRVESVEVHLMSRALAYMPKGDRVAHEIWQRSADGVWYSAKRPDAE